MLKLYKGQQSSKCLQVKHASCHISNAINYMGIQVATFAAGCFAQLVIFSIVITFIAYFFVVPIVYNFESILINFLRDIS